MNAIKETQGHSPTGVFVPRRLQPDHQADQAFRLRIPNMDDYERRIMTHIALIRTRRDTAA
jgi:uncharacterized membrane-anchored protein